MTAYSFVLFLLLFYINYNVDARNATCIYKYEIFDIGAFEDTGESLYTCTISSFVYDEEYDTYLEFDYATFEDLEQDVNLTINGEHKKEKNDNSVQLLLFSEIFILKTFSSIFCEKFPFLQVIQTQNMIESITDDSLINCRNLKIALLKSNNHQISENFLHNNQDLIEFGLTGTELTTLPEKIFVNAVQLEVLILSMNKFWFLPGSIFKPLVKLKQLFLGNNNFQSINPEWFVNLENLKILNLEHNSIKEIRSEIFIGLQNLEFLTLQGNKISQLPTNVFDSLIKLSELDLSFNQLTVIHSDSLGGLKLLSDINLENNKINAIDEEFLKGRVINNLTLVENNCYRGFLNYLKSSRLIEEELRKCFDNYQNSMPNQNSESCGKSKVSINGSNIIHGSFPWIASLLHKTEKFICGATLVTNRKVITAAHCIQDKNKRIPLFTKEIKILLGVYDILDNDEFERSLHDVHTIKIHPDWDTKSQSYNADIALLILDRKVTFNKFIQPICLGSLNTDVASIPSGVIVGYGKSEDWTQGTQKIPRMVVSPIQTNENCFLHNSLLLTLSSAQTFCAGTRNGIGVCKEDAGSGLFVTDGHNYYLRGIVSASINISAMGCVTDTFSVFTDVTKYTSWINGESLYIF